MMKAVRNAWLYLAAMVLSLGMAACGDDDDEVSVSTMDLVGTWVCTHTVYTDSDGNRTESDEYGEADMTFRADGTATVDGDNATWSLSGNTLNLTYPVDGTISSTITSFTGNTMTIAVREEEPGYWEQEETTWQRK